MDKKAYKKLLKELRSPSLYIPKDLTRAQTKLLLKLHELHGIGCTFQADACTIKALVSGGYAEFRYSNYFMLTEKAQHIATANN